MVGGLLPHLKDYLLEVITSSSAGSTGSAAASAPGSCPTSTHDCSTYQSKIGIDGERSPG